MNTRVGSEHCRLTLERELQSQRQPLQKAGRALLTWKGFRLGSLNGLHAKGAKAVGEQEARVRGAKGKALFASQKSCEDPGGQCTRHGGVSLSPLNRAT
jgi:hypothetical protein